MASASEFETSLDQGLFSIFIAKSDSKSTARTQCYFLVFLLLFFIEPL